MGKFRITEVNAPSGMGPHRDYTSNLFNARVFIKRVEPSLEKGMRTYISSSQDLPDSLMIVSFTPPRTAPMGNYAAPIFLHQSSSEYSKQVEGVFNAYMKMAKDFWSQYNKQIQGDLFDAI